MNIKKFSWGNRFIYLGIAVVVIVAIVIFPNISAFMRTIQQVVVDESRSGQEVKLGEGDQLLAILGSNPSTGYSWSLVAMSNPDVLKYVSSEYQSPAGSSPPGAAGHERWLFKGQSRGKTTINLDYTRPTESNGKPGKTFTLTVVVE